MADIFIKNALVMTCEPDVIRGEVIENGAVAVSGSTIEAIGKSSDLEEKYKDTPRVIDADGAQPAN
jgi:cytosine/adenosine deaminase-related metal-dependent hydrolase